MTGFHLAHGGGKDLRQRQPTTKYLRTIRDQHVGLADPERRMRLAKCLPAEGFRSVAKERPFGFGATVRRQHTVWTHQAV